MKSLIISIQPQWIEKILNGEKTTEIRKTMPKCELPCKVYIYCTKPKKWFRYSSHSYTSNEFLWKAKDKVKMCDGFEFYNESDCITLNGKVVAEFTLNKITKHEKNFLDCEEMLCYNFKTCDVKKSGFETDIFGLVDFDNFVEDYGKGKTLFAWHIDNLKIYDRPKELSEFRKENKCHYTDYDKGCCFECCTFYDLGDCDGRCSKREKPPQSWCYVEES